MRRRPSAIPVGLPCPVREAATGPGVCGGASGGEAAMRHSLAQLLAASSGRERSAACSLPSEEAPEEPGPGREEGAEDELLFPAGLELDDWLEAAAAAAEEARPGWETGGSPSEAEAESAQARPGTQRLKAAAAARLNRQRKKQYVQGLESRLQGLAVENRQLRDRNRGLCRRLRRLEREAGYLRAVLANQSALGRLLSHLAGGIGPGLRIGTSLFEEEREEAWLPCESSSSSSSDHDYALPVPEEEEEEADQDCKRGAPASSSPSPGGICLHLDRDQVSVEFCSLCARRAATSVLTAASVSPSSLAYKMCLPCQAPLCRG